MFKLHSKLKEINPNDIESANTIWQIVEILPDHYRLKCIKTYDPTLLKIGTTYADIKEDIETIYTYADNY